MKLPIAWLRDYLELDLSTDDVAARLAALGFPVDGIERRPKLSGVRIGRIDDVAKHPDADRLVVCTVDIAGDRPLTIATAATNVRAGDVVPVAVIGAELVGVTIGPRKMRGVASEGMLCSAAELGLESAWFEDGILQLETTLEIGADFVETFGLDDDVLDVEITANRVDAMSVVGLARELAASLGRTIREPDTSIDRDRTILQPDVRVTIETPDCTRFVAQRFSKVAVRPAPFWMRVRLALAGQRPIDNLVDISNFVMLETAQPLHFYDIERVAGRHLIARDARPGEPLRTLDDAERALDARFLVIADEREPQGIAGLKGGAESAVRPDTTEIVMEAATFSGPRVRRMSVALGLRTEASSRHEKGLPPGLADWGAARAAHLLQGEGALVHAPVASGPPQVAAEPIRVAMTRFQALLGVEISLEEADRALSSLGFRVTADSAAGAGDAPAGAGETVAIAVTVPPWRGDVRIAEDVIEEVARIVGYERIVAEMPPILEQHVTSDAYRTESRIAHALAALGYREAVTLSLQPASFAARYTAARLVPPAVVELRNPLSEEQRYLRFSLLPALLELASRRSVGATERVFELGHVFEGAPEAFESAEVVWLYAVPASEEPAWHDAGFLQFKGESLALVRALTGRDAETVTATLAGWHPGKTATLLVDGRDLATIGAVDPRLARAYGVDGRVYAGRMRSSDLPTYRVAKYRAPSRYPAVVRDLALVVAPDMPAIDIERAIRIGGEEVIAGVRVFDEYRGPQVGEGKKSLAVRVTLQRADATLTDAEAEAYVDAMLERVRERCGAQIRT
ncbi:MAG: phenylalanine--tRNA ligase subunit beta [Vulcanimicrobiaceae bacterium]